MTPRRATRVQVKAPSVAALRVWCFDVEHDGEEEAVS